MKIHRKIISLLVVFLLLVGLVPTVVSADDAPLTISEIWSLMNGREYKSAELDERFRNNTLAAVTDGDSRVFRFSDGKNTIDIKADDLKEYEDDMSVYGENGYYNYSYGENDLIAILVTDGVVMHMRIYSEALCDYTNYEYDLSGNYIDSSIGELGTVDYPWMLGDLRVSFEENALWIEGEGEIPDYSENALDTRIWDSFSGEIEHIFVADNVTRIGDNAFRGVGKNAVTVDLYSSVLDEIGASAFEGVPTDAEMELYIPETVKVIGPRAFADTKSSDIVFNSCPDEIADDAFAGVSAKVGTKHGQFDETKKLSYGGELDYYDIFLVHFDIFAGEENNGWMEFELPYGETYSDSFYEEYGIGYVFDHAWLVAGTIDGFDGTSLEYTISPVDDIIINVYYVYDEEAAAAHEGEDDGSYIFDGDIDGEELAEMILGNETVSKTLKTFTAIMIAVTVLVFAGIAVAIFFIVRAIVKKKKKKADGNADNE